MAKKERESNHFAMLLKYYGWDFKVLISEQKVTN